MPAVQLTPVDPNPMWHLFRQWWLVLSYYGQLITKEQLTATSIISCPDQTPITNDQYMCCFCFQSTLQWWSVCWLMAHNPRLHICLTDSSECCCLQGVESSSQCNQRPSSVVHAVALYVCLVAKEAEIHVLIITWFVDMVGGAGYFSIWSCIWFQSLKSWSKF